MKKIIIEKVKQMAGNNWLNLDDAIQVKKTPHSPACRIWAICISPDNVIYLMDNNEQSFPLEENDINHNLVIASLYQRVMLINKKTA
jgi:hypothetical protein